MPTGRAMTGNAGNNDCEGNNGCGVQAPTADSYGPSFNAIGGGFYAMERTDSSISVWFFPRNGNVPGDLQSGAQSIDTDNWVCLTGSCCLYLIDSPLRLLGHADCVFPKH